MPLSERNDERLPPAKAQETKSSSGKTGAKVIARILKTLPSKPGVYRMIDRDGELLYVGKARNLKKRVQSYARLGGHTHRIARMISATASMEFVTTGTETEALLLEANLIKRLRPRFNVFMRDDKSFPYILLSADHEAPQIHKHRGARKREGDYFGPFASAGAVNRTINTLQRAFLLRSCSDSYYENRSRPCLLYQIKRCSAPCTGKISIEDYATLVEDARTFLNGKSKAVKHQLNALMENASKDLEFELAATYRDRMAALNHIHAHQGINPRTLSEADVFAAHSEGGQTCVQIFFYRTGQNWGNRAYFLSADKSVPTQDVLDPFIAQFYDNKPAPKLILLSHAIAERALLAEALTTRSGRGVQISVPQRGEKKDLVDHALTNAREALGRRLAESASQRDLLEGMAHIFDLDEPPKRIEIYDNSHIQGSNPVGAMVVATVEGFAKQHYRKFNIKSQALTPGDDCAMMREVLTRRFSRLLKEAGEPERRVRKVTDEIPSWPELVLIDGGAGQLSAAQETFDELGVTGIRLVGIAKGPERNAGHERFHMDGRTSFLLEPRDPVLYYVQRLRDEAHRYAIVSHRARRKKAMSTPTLDGVPGIGPKRKRALLLHFGSAKAVSRAGLADLQSVAGISAKMAQTIYDYSHE